MSNPKIKESISLQEAKDRALRYLGGLHRLELTSPAATSLYIWPGHNMRAQGAGLAAVRILELMKADSLAVWVSDTHPKRWGWRITAEGRARLRRLS